MFYVQEETQRLKDQILKEKNELTQLLDKKNHELDQIQEDMSNISQKLKEANLAKISAQVKADEAMSESNVAKVSVAYLFMAIEENLFISSGDILYQTNCKSGMGR